MYGTTFAYSSIGEENTGSVFFDLEGVFVFEKISANLSVTYLKMPGNTVNILCRNKKR